MSEQSGPEAWPDNATDEVDDTYYLDDGDLPVMGHLVACNKCGRKLLVEMALIGSQHHVGVTVICGDCLVVPERMRNEHPEIVSKIESWLHGGPENTQDSSGIPVPKS